MEKVLSACLLSLMLNLQKVIDAFEPLSVKAGTKIIEQGDTVNVQKLYLIASGVCACSIKRDGKESVVHVARSAKES